MATIVTVPRNGGAPRAAILGATAGTGGTGATDVLRGARLVPASGHAAGNGDYAA